MEIKKERQGRLSRHFPPPPRLEVIISEGVLLGNTEIPGGMQQQIWHLLKVNEENRALIRLLPLATGPHRASVSGAFTILEFPAADVGDKSSIEPPTVYSESITGARYLDKPHEIAMHEAVWATLDGLALSVEDSNRLISKVLREKNDHE